MDWNSIGIGASGGALQFGLNQITAKQQFERNKKMMDIQFRNQMELNRQGADLSYENWKRTSYGAQLEQMKKAGLSPGLMYGQGGGQGGTTAGSGGSASSGSVQQASPMDIANLALLAANVKKTEAEASNIEQSTEESKSRQDLISSQIDQIGQNMKESQSKIELIGVQTELAELQRDVDASTIGIRIRRMEKDLDIAIAEARSAIVKADVDEGTKQSQMDAVKLSAIQIGVQNALIRKQTELTDEQIFATIEGVSQKWEEVNAKIRGVGAQERANVIKTFEAEMKANYPGVMNVMGSFIKEQLDADASFKGQESYRKVPK